MRSSAPTGQDDLADDLVVRPSGRSSPSRNSQGATVPAPRATTLTTTSLLAVENLKRGKKQIYTAVSAREGCQGRPLGGRSHG